MNVLLVTPAYPAPDQETYVGIQRLAEGIVHGLAQNDVQVRIITTYWGPVELPELTTTADGFPVYRLWDLSQPLGRMGRLAALDSYTFGRAVAKQDQLLHNADVVHSLMELGAERRISTPIVTTHHHWGTVDSPVEYLHDPFHKALKRYAYRYADAITVPSTASKRELTEKLWGRVPPLYVVPHGVDTEKFSPSADGDQHDGIDIHTILYVGPFEARKRISDLVEAVSILHRDSIEVELVLVGDGSLWDSVASDVRRRGLTDRVRMPGYLSDEELLDHYRNADLFVLPSTHEGFGQVVLEAMATGTPPLVADIPPLNEIVTDDTLLFDPCAPASIADTIREVLTEHDLSKLAAIFRSRSLEYDWSRIARRYVKVYDDLLEVNSRS